MLRRFQIHPSSFINTATSSAKFTNNNNFFCVAQQQNALMTRVRYASGVGSSKAAASATTKKVKVDPKELPAPTWKDKIKKELMLILKLNLVLVPVLVLGSLWWFPPTSPQKEKELQELYKQSAGWKT